MDYGAVLLSENDGEIPLNREIVQDDLAFAQAIVHALCQCMVPPPQPALPNSKSLQGNLCEFCVWELGEKRWKWYRRKFSRSANAWNPWRDSSDPGIDILATDEEVSTLMVIEVKSSQGDGDGHVKNKKNSLRSDFEGLFEGDGRGRLLSRVMEIASDLKFLHERPDLAERVRKLVGSSPSESPGVRLIGVLVCTRGDGQSHGKRRQAFENLHTWLTQNDIDPTKKWKAGQCRYCTVELKDLLSWIEELKRTRKGSPSEQL
jgi:hypothetical protein